MIDRIICINFNGSRQWLLYCVLGSNFMIFWAVKNVLSLHRTINYLMKQVKINYERLKMKLYLSFKTQKNAKISMFGFLGDSQGSHAIYSSILLLAFYFTSILLTWQNFKFKRENFSGFFFLSSFTKYFKFQSGTIEIVFLSSVY